MNPPELFGGDVEADADVPDPLDLLDRWLGRVDSGAAGAVAVGSGAPGSEPAGTDSATTPLMALATVDADGFPRVRHVLLSAYDRGRLHFHTDTRTEKAAELAANPRAGATIVWPDIPRQLSVTGTVTAESAQEQVRAFTRRTRYLQVLAWVNDTELARRSAAERAQVWQEFDAGHPDLTPPPTWIGYVLVPQRITFWRGGPGGPSQRLVCERTDAGWRSERLPG